MVLVIGKRKSYLAANSIKKTSKKQFLKQKQGKSVTFASGVYQILLDPQTDPHWIQASCWCSSQSSSSSANLWSSSQMSTKSSSVSAAMMAATVSTAGLGFLGAKTGPLDSLSFSAWRSQPQCLFYVSSTVSTAGLGSSGAKILMYDCA